MFSSKLAKQDAGMLKGGGRGGLVFFVSWASVYSYHCHGSLKCAFGKLFIFFLMLIFSWYALS